jgi:hypothetical protein
MVMSQNFPSFFDGILPGDAAYAQQASALSDLYARKLILNAYKATPSLTGAGPISADFLWEVWGGIRNQSNWTDR